MANARTRKGYADIAALTKAKCASSCRSLAPFRCCDPMYCEMAIAYAKDQGVILQRAGHPTLPLMAEDKSCTAPPHLRPICSVHHCDINSLGFFKGDAKATRRYFTLRARLEADADVDVCYDLERKEL